VLDRRLGGYAAGPEDGDFILRDRDGIAVRWDLDGFDPEFLGSPDVYRLSVSERERTGESHNVLDGIPRDRPHRDNERPGEDTGRLRCPIGDVHRDVPAELDVANRDAMRGDKPVKREAAAKQKRNEIIVPERHHFGRLLDHPAIAEYTVAGQIGA